MKKVWEQDIGGIVLCDSCNTDYSNSDEQGGLIVGSRVYCPACEDRIRASLKKYNEENHITREPREGESFREMVLDFRGGQNTVALYTFEDPDDFFNALFGLEDVDDE